MKLKIDSMPMGEYDLERRFELLDEEGEVRASDLSRADADEIAKRVNNWDLLVELLSALIAQPRSVRCCENAKQVLHNLDPK